MSLSILISLISIDSSFEKVGMFMEFLTSQGNVFIIQDYGKANETFISKYYCTEGISTILDYI